MGDGEGGAPRAPEWLPEGWIMKISTRKNGKVDRYFVSPVSGYTFRSRVEVLRYLNVEKVNELPPVTTTCSEEDKPCVTECSDEDKPCVTECSEEDKPSDVKQVKNSPMWLPSGCCSEEDKPSDVKQVKNSPTWLPSGWILDVRTHQHGASAGKKYKCYIDPSTGSSFYTKAEVFHYLKTGKSSNSTSKKKKLSDPEPKEEHLCNSTSNQNNINSDSKDNVLTLVETSPDGLPPGWIKEVRCKKNASGVRRDPYYIDPVSGYVFRSKKDAIRYIENGEISKHAFKSKKKRSANEMSSMENESPQPMSANKLKGQGGEGTQVKRHLFEGKLRKSSRKTTAENNELLKGSSSPAANNALLQSEETAGPSSEAPSDAILFKGKSVMVQDQSNLRQNELPDKPLEAADEEALDQVIEKLLDSVNKSSPGPSDGKWSGPVSENLQNPSNMEWLEVKPADNIKSQSSEPVDNSVEPTAKKQLEFRCTRAKMMAKQKTMESVETVCDIRMKPSNEKSQEVGVNEKMELADQNGKLLETEEKLIRSNLSESHETFTLAYGKISGQRIEESKEKEGKISSTGSPRPHKSKARSEKLTPITRRASKRLSGQEADPAADIEVSDKSLKRGRSSTQSKPSSARIPLNNNQEVELEMLKPKEELLREQVEAEMPKPREEPLGDQADSETPKLKEPQREQVDIEEQGRGDGVADRDLEFTMASPFGDSWPDPCIEFAFKTLTGDFPVLDTTAIEGYLHEQLSSVQVPSPDVLHPSGVGDCPDGRAEVEAEVQVSSAGRDNSLPGNNMPPQTRGRVKRLCRRSISKRNPSL